jgi:hypothetical protein
MAQRDMHSSLEQYAAPPEPGDPHQEKFERILMELAEETEVGDVELLWLRERAQQFQIVYDKFGGKLQR